MSMSRRGDNIRKRKDGRWEGRYIFMRDSIGKAVYRSVYGKTYTEVKEKLSSASALKSQYSKEKRKGTFNEAAQSWLKEVKYYKKYSTYVKYENIYLKHIMIFWGNKKMKDITEEMCVSFINSKRNNNNSQKLSSSTLYSIKNVLVQIIRYGTGNESFRIENTQKPGCSLNKVETLQIFTKAEQQRIFEYLITDIDNYKLGILVCFFTGLRLGEICALKRENIDLTNRTIRISEENQSR